MQGDFAELGRRADRDIDAVTGGRVHLTDDLLRESTARETVVRMLANLRGVYARRGDWRRALRFAELGHAIQPGSPELLRERGLILLQMEEFGRATADLEEYLRRRPEAQDAGVIREHLQLARKPLARVN